MARDEKGNAKIKISCQKAIEAQFYNFCADFPNKKMSKFKEALK